MAEENLNKSLIKPVTIASALVSIIQAISWTVLAFLAIVFYYGDELGENGDTFGYYMYILFISDRGCLENIDNVIITPTVFFGIMWLYGFLSFTWLIISLYLLQSTFLEKFKRIDIIFGFYASILIVVSVVDAIFVGLLSYDYVQLENYLDSLILNENSSSTINVDAKHVVLVTHGIVLSLAARGYVLWVVNVIFGVIFCKFAHDTIHARNEYQRRRTFINAYETTPSSNFVNWDNNTTNSNNHYQGNNGLNNPSFERSESFYPVLEGPKIYGENRNGKRAVPVKPPVLPTSQQYKPTAPYIPEPDYTPLSSPQSDRRLKGVLKTNTNY